MAMACAAAIVACSLLLIATNSSLVGDGSYYLLRAIQTGQPFQLSGRQGINFLREGPLLLARDHGVTNTHLLAVVEGIGFILFPALVWVLAIVLARGSRLRFAVVAISCGLTFATTITFSASELTLALPLVVLASVLLTQPRPWTVPSAALVVVSTGLLFFSHESIVPCAAMLAVMAIHRLTTGVTTRDTAVSIVALALSIADLLGALWTLVFWPNRNSSTFSNFSQSIALLTLGAICLIGWSVLFGRMQGAEWVRWLLLAGATLLTLLGIGSGIHAGAHAAYDSRGFSLVVIVMSQVVLFADRARLRRESQNGRRIQLSKGAARGATGFLVAVMILPTACALQWSIVLSDFESTVTNRTGLVPSAEVATPTSEGYLWSWTNTTLSVLTRSSTSDAVVENTGRLEPFPIGEAEQQLPAKYRWTN